LDGLDLGDDDEERILTIWDFDL